MIGERIREDKSKIDNTSQEYTSYKHGDGLARSYCFVYHGVIFLSNAP